MWGYVVFYYQTTSHSQSEGVLLDYWPIGSNLYPCQARLYSIRMIWLLTHHLTPSPVIKLNQRYTGRRKKRQLAGEGRGAEGVGEEK